MADYTGRCPDDSELRAHLDGEAGDGSLVSHVGACASCRWRFGALEREAVIAADLLSQLEPKNDAMNASAALATWRMRQNAGTGEERGFDLMRLWNRRGPRLATAVAGVFALLMVVVISPMGSVAGDILDRFRVENFAAITIEMDDFQEFQAGMFVRLMTADQEDLADSVMNLGDYTTTFNEDDPLANVQEFASADEARAAFGEFDTTDEVPDGYAQTPVYYVSDAGSVTVTINNAEAQAIIDELNLPIYALPDAAAYPTLDFVVEVPPALVQDFQGPTEEDHIVVAQLASPTLITPDGIDMDELREELLRLPGLPPDFVAQLRSIDDWRTTLVVPVPEGHSSEDVTINGEPGLLITSDDGEGAVALWEHDGILFIVGGTESGDIISDVADSLD
jgi:hypothetical protein